LRLVSGNHNVTGIVVQSAIADKRRSIKPAPVWPG
jgi:hypothetical protein